MWSTTNTGHLSETLVVFAIAMFGTSILKKYTRAGHDAALSTEAIVGVLNELLRKLLRGDKKLRQTFT